MTIKLIATDIDGTLLNSHHQISPRNERTLKQAMAQGVKVVLATGRPRSTTSVKFIEQLGLSTPGIFLQGLSVHHPDGSLHSHRAFDPELADSIITLAEQHQVALMAYCDLNIMVADRNVFTDRVLGYGEPEPQVVGSLRNLLGKTAINKLVFFDDLARIANLRSEFHAIGNGNVHIVQTLIDCVEILPHGTSKGSALKILLDEMDIDPAEVMALGDAENDIEMLQLAGIGVAMGNAMPAAKAAADYITATNDEDGLALAVERFVLA